MALIQQHDCPHKRRSGHGRRHKGHVYTVTNVQRRQEAGHLHARARGPRGTRAATDTFLLLKPPAPGTS